MSNTALKQEIQAQGKTDILIVDDDDSIRKLLKRILETRGYLCAVAGDADEALHFIAKQCVELVVSDIMMPGKSGIQLLEGIADEPGPFSRFIGAPLPLCHRTHGAHLVVDRDVAALVELHACGLEANARRVGLEPYRDENLFRFDDLLLAIGFDGDLCPPAAPVELGGLALEMNVGAALFEVLLHHANQVGIGPGK